MKMTEIEISDQSVERCARLFLELGNSDQTKENVGGQLLDFLRDEECQTIEHATVLFQRTYALNNWQLTAGRPREGSTHDQVPTTVRHYVSAIKRAYRGGLDVLAFETMRSLRNAVREYKQLEAEMSGSIDPELRGLRLSNAARLNGNPYHDLPMLAKQLPEKDRQATMAKVKKILDQIMRKVLKEVPQAA